MIIIAAALDSTSRTPTRMGAKFRLEKFNRGMHYISLSAPTAKKFIDNGNKRIVCTLNNTVEIHCAIMSKKEVGYFINIGNDTCKKLKLAVGSILEASFRSDDSKYQFEMPEELSEVLDSDSEADKIFQALTGGNKRGLIYFVLQVKSTDKRIERALKIAAKIKIGITSPKLMYK